MASKKTGGPSPADVVVGSRIRRARLEAGRSQQSLAAAIDISYQQIQKYETGKNRVSAGALVDIAATLNKPIAWFYEDIERSHEVREQTPEELLYAQCVTILSTLRSSGELPLIKQLLELVARKSKS